MSEQIQGNMNGHLVGYVIKEMVRRVGKVIRSHRFNFEAQDKVGYDGKMGDVVTSADKAAQVIYERMIREGFPTAGIIAEESELRVECTDKSLGDLYFTVDPLDGTKAFVRKESQGVATMIALVQGNDVISVCIGNVLTNEMFYYRPGGSNVHRIGESELAESISPKIGEPLNKQVVLLRDAPDMHSTFIEQLAKRPRDGGLCMKFKMADGSIGLSMSRLWTGEVGLCVQGEVTTTPWDTTPIIGMNKRLGIVQLQQDDLYFSPKPYKLEKELFKQPETIYLHESNLEEFMHWQEKTLERLR